MKKSVLIIIALVCFIYLSSLYDVLSKQYYLGSLYYKKQMNKFYHILQKIDTNITFIKCNNSILKPFEGYNRAILLPIDDQEKLVDKIESNIYIFHQSTILKKDIREIVSNTQEKYFLLEKMLLDLSIKLEQQNEIKKILINNEKHIFFLKEISYEKGYSKESINKIIDAYYNKLSALKDLDSKKIHNIALKTHLNQIYLLEKTKNILYHT